MAFPSGYTSTTWAALTPSQRIAVVFSEIDECGDFVVNPANASRFAWAGNYLLVHRPSTNTVNSRTQVYADLRARVELAEGIARAYSPTLTNCATFVRGRPI